MIRRLIRSEFFVLLLCALLLAVLGPVTPGLLSADNLTNIAGAMLPLLLVAAGQTVVLIGGGIDLSATSIIALTSVTGAKMITESGGWMAGNGGAAVPAAAGVMLLLGAFIGLINGSVISRLHMPAFIATLTLMMAVSGLAVWFTQSKNISGLPPSFLLLGQSLPVAVGITAGAVALIHVLLTRSIFGRRLQAVGHNARTAHVSGVPVARMITLSYVVSGLCAAAASVLLTARLETGSPVLGQTMMLDVIGAAVIGGTSLFGGRGSVLWTVFGVLFLTLLDNALNLRGLSHFAIMMVKGAVILTAAGLDTLRRRTNS